MSAINSSRHDRVLRLEIEAPPVNVLDTAILTELADALEACAADDGLSAVLVSGAGKCFSAGASVSEHRPDQARAMIEALGRACTALAELPVPAVALVHGACLGGAMELVAFADVVVADPGATFGQPEVKLAFFPPLACAALPRLVGYQNAAAAILTGADIPAQRALEMGLVQRLLAHDEWDRVAVEMNRLSGSAVRMTKRALTLATAPPARELVAELERLFLEDLYRLEDVSEGIASFEERRRPSWKHA